MQDIQYSKKKACLLQTLAPLLANNVVPKSMASKIAGSGLEYGHLKCVISRDGLDGLRTLLMAKTGNKMRVTAKESTITALYDHFMSLE